jgi:hypothetical protein
MNTLATAILGTLAVSCLVIGLQPASAAGIAAQSCGDYGGQVHVGSGDLACLLSSSTCVMGTEVSLWTWGGFAGIIPSLDAGWNVHRC